MVPVPVGSTEEPSSDLTGGFESAKDFREIILVVTFSTHSSLLFWQHRFPEVSHKTALSSTGTSLLLL